MPKVYQKKIDDIANKNKNNLRFCFSADNFGFWYLIPVNLLSEFLQFNKNNDTDGIFSFIDYQINDIEGISFILPEEIKEYLA